MIIISRYSEKAKEAKMSEAEEQAQKEYYTAREAAEYLGIPMHRLARLRRQKRIRSIVEDGDPKYAVYHISALRSVDVSDLRRKATKKTEDTEGDSEYSSSVVK
jgi:hypothetical protein